MTLRKLHESSHSPTHTGLPTRHILRYVTLSGDSGRLRGKLLHMCAHSGAHGVAHGCTHCIAYGGTNRIADCCAYSVSNRFTNGGTVGLSNSGPDIVSNHVNYNDVDSDNDNENNHDGNDNNTAHAV